MVTSSIDHDEAMIQSWMRHPEHAKFAMDEAIKERDFEDIKIIWERIQEVMLRLKLQSEAKSA
ncbi:MAG: hypothetical protein IJ859_01485 [Synergistaceae bacterium]|nr:hypothetical protein [Synergistaceae bacterium]